MRSLPRDSRSARALSVRACERVCAHCGYARVLIHSCVHQRTEALCQPPLPVLRVSGRMPCLLTSASSASQSLWATLLVVLERFEDALTAYSRWRKILAATLCNVRAAVDISHTNAKVCRSSDVTAHAHLRRALPL